MQIFDAIDKMIIRNKANVFIHVRFFFKISTKVARFLQKRKQLYTFFRQ